MPEGRAMFLTLDNGSELKLLTHWLGLTPIFSLDNGAASSCPLAAAATTCFGTALELCMTVMDDVTGG